ncbi:MAG: 5-oxoprolinase subunit PxpA, partial [Bacteroidia bacterium]|nr:5-oxoprolinase subunit PxpA [Bacteroidia bacterium]
CGGHAGDDETMNQVVELAKKNRVKIGAHPSFPDPENFGRIPMEMPCAALYHTVKSQITRLMKVLRSNDAQLHHVKPHGALYNQAASDKRTAIVVLEAVKSIPFPLQLYVPFGSVIADLAIEEGVHIKYEVFADRNYNDDLSLVSRKLSNALITDKSAMSEHVIRMVSRGRVKTITGKEVPIKAETICVHGDNPKAVSLVKYLHKQLRKNQVEIQ